MKIKLVLCLLLILFLTMIPLSVAYAQIWKYPEGHPKAGQNLELTELESLKILAGNIINFLLSIASTLAVLFLIVGGIFYITSAGNPEGIEKAKNAILYSVIGLILCILAFAIVNFIVLHLKLTSVKIALNSISRALLSIAGTIAVLFMIIGGFQYITSAGNPDAIEKAKNTILYAVIGLLACILSYAVINFIVTQIV